MKIDAETHEVLSSSKGDLGKSTFRSLDSDYENLDQNPLDFFILDGDLYYGIPRFIGDSLFYYAAKISRLSFKDLINELTINSLVASLVFVIGCQVIVRYALKGYTPEYFQTCLAAGSGTGSGFRTRNTEAEPKKLSSYFSEVVTKWEKFTPEQKTFRVFGLSNGLIMLVLLAAAVSSLNAPLAFFITGNWQKGINPFAIAAIAVVLCLWYLFYIVADVIFLIIHTFVNPKRRTIFQLAFSIVRYVLVLALIYNSLNYLGVNTSALIASVGINSLALSLWAQGMVSDILAGLGIILDGEFQAGDIVEIDGFKGIVEEIGMRSTRLCSHGTNNVKIINNRDIQKVINYSRRISMFSIEIRLPALFPMERVREYLSGELPAIREEIPQIISGPVFSGIKSLNRNYMTILITGQCLEQDMSLVNLRMNDHLKERLDKLVGTYLEEGSENMIKDWLIR